MHPRLVGRGSAMVSRRAATSPPVDPEEKCGRAGRRWQSGSASSPQGLRPPARPRRRPRCCLNKFDLVALGGEYRSDRDTVVRHDPAAGYGCAAGSRAENHPSPLTCLDDLGQVVDPQAQEAEPGGGSGGVAGVGCGVLGAELKNRVPETEPANTHVREDHLAGRLESEDVAVEAEREILSRTMRPIPAPRSQSCETWVGRAAETAAPPTHDSPAGQEPTSPRAQGVSAQLASPAPSTRTAHSRGRDGRTR